MVKVRDIENLPDKMPMHRHKRDGKKFCQCHWCYERHYNRDWKFAKSWIKSKVGQLVDNVFSEFVKLDNIPAEQRNLKFFRQFIETETFIKDNKIAFYDNYCSDIQYVDNQWSGCFYKNPKTGILEYAPKKKLKQKKKEKTFYNIGEFRQIIQIDGIWYEAWYNQEELNKLYKKPVYNEKTPITETRIYKVNEFLTEYGLMLRIKLQKRQLNHKELTARGLKNKI